MIPKGAVPGTGKTMAARRSCAAINQYILFIQSILSKETSPGHKGILFVPFCGYVLNS
jgi:hypothetical protein